MPAYEDEEHTYCQYSSGQGERAKSQWLAYRSSQMVSIFIPLFRIFGNSEHFYTINSDEIGTTTPGVTGNYGYISEGIACYLSPVA